MDLAAQVRSGVADESEKLDRRCPEDPRVPKFPARGSGLCAAKVWDGLASVEVEVSG